MTVAGQMAFYYSAPNNAHQPGVAVTTIDDHGAQSINHGPNDAHQPGISLLNETDRKTVKTAELNKLS